jgi:hypothetical protein
MRKGWIVLFVLFPILIQAQSRLDKPEMYLGVTGGATGSMVVFNPAVNQSYLQGYNAGIVFRYIAERNVGVQAELNYSQRGWKESSGLFCKQLNYIELPFMTHIYMGDKNRFFINLGPKVAYLISEKNLIDNTVNSTEVQQITPIQNKFDYGLCLGFGLSFKINRNTLQLDTRAYYALSDIYSNSKKNYFGNSNNLNVSLNLAWLMQVK